MKQVGQTAGLALLVGLLVLMRSPLGVEAQNDAFNESADDLLAVESAVGPSHSRSVSDVINDNLDENREAGPNASEAESGSPRSADFNITETGGSEHQAPAVVLTIRGREKANNQPKSKVVKSKASKTSAKPSLKGANTTAQPADIEHHNQSKKPEEKVAKDEADKNATKTSGDNHYPTGYARPLFWKNATKSPESDGSTNIEPTNEVSSTTVKPKSSSGTKNPTSVTPTQPNSSGQTKPSRSTISPEVSMRPADNAIPTHEGKGLPDPSGVSSSTTKSPVIEIKLNSTSTSEKPSELSSTKQPKSNSSSTTGRPKSDTTTMKPKDQLPASKKLTSTTPNPINANNATTKLPENKQTEDESSSQTTIFPSKDRSTVKPDKSDGKIGGFNETIGSSTSKPDLAATTTSQPTQAAKSSSVANNQTTPATKQPKEAKLVSSTVRPKSKLTKLISTRKPGKKTVDIFPATIIDQNVDRHSSIGPSLRAKPHRFPSRTPTNQDDGDVMALVTSRAGSRLKLKPLNNDLVSSMLMNNVRQQPWSPARGFIAGGGLMGSGYTFPSGIYYFPRPVNFMGMSTSR